MELVSRGLLSGSQAAPVCTGAATLTCWPAPFPSTSAVRSGPSCRDAGTTVRQSATAALSARLGADRQPRLHRLYRRRWNTARLSREPAGRPAAAGSLRNRAIVGPAAGGRCQRHPCLAGEPAARGRCSDLWPHAEDRLNEPSAALSASGARGGLTVCSSD